MAEATADDAHDGDKSRPTKAARLVETWNERYGDEPDADAIVVDLEAADQQTLFDQLDKKGMNLLHYFGSFDASDDFGTGPLVQRILGINIKAAQVVDNEGHLPLDHFAAHIGDLSDDQLYLTEALAEDPPSVEHLIAFESLLPAFPEAVFSSGIIDELGIDLNGEEEDQRVLQGLLHLSFPQGFQHIPTAETVLQTGCRVPFHVLCSYAYEPVFQKIYDLFFTPESAAVPDVSFSSVPSGIFPLHLALKCPTLPRPQHSKGHMLGFHQMRQKGLAVSLKTVQKLVEAHPPALDLPDENGCFPLHLATRHGVELVKHLAKLSPRHLASVDNRGCTPYQFACEHNCDVDVIYFLLRANPLQLFKSKNCLIKDDHVDDSIAPVIAPIPLQKVNHTLLKISPSLVCGSAPVTWSVSATPSNAFCINKTTGQINYWGPQKLAVVAVVVCCENVAGWSTVTFNIEQT